MYLTFTCSTGVLESSASILADTSSLIVLAGLVFALILVLSLIVIIIVCFRRHSRRRRKYKSVCRDPPAGGDLPLKAFPDGGDRTETYHAGCDLGLSASGSVCLCRDLSGGLPSTADTASVSSSVPPPATSGCRACDVTTASHKMAAASDCYPRCAAEVGQP